MTQKYNQDLKKGDKKNASSVNEDIVKKYIELFDRLPIGIYRTTPDGKILTANPAFLSLLGFSNFEDFEGIDVNKTHKNPDDRKVFMKEVEEKGEVYAKESILVDSKGNEIIVEEYAKGYKNEEGRVIFYEGIVINITEKKQRIKRIEFLNGFKELILNLTTSFINIRLTDIDDRIVHSLQSIGTFIGSDRSYVFLFDDKEMKRMSNTHESLAEGVSSVIDELQDLSTADYPWWMDNLRKNKAIIIQNINDLPPEASNEKQIFKRQSVLSLFAVPMFFEYQLIGFLGFDMIRQYKVVDDDTLELLEIAATVFANILNYQETEQEIIRSRKTLEILIEKRTQELENLNKQFKMLAECSNDVIWTMNMNLQTNYMSPSVFKYLGYTPEEYLAMPLEKRLPPESMSKVKEVVTHELASLKDGKRKSGEDSVIFEMLHKTKNGELVWGEVSFNFLIDADGNPTGIHGITRNVHERKLAEKALWESNERFKGLVENTSDWLWETDTNGVYTYASPVCEKMLGYKTNEIIGKSFVDFLNPKSRKDVLSFFRNIAKSKKPFRNLENVAMHKNGRQVFLETSGIPIYDIKGVFIGYRGIDRDITEKRSVESSLRHSQQKLSQHLRNTPMGYIEWDSNFEVIEWNPAAQQIFGYNKTQAMVSNMIEKLVPIDQRDETMSIFPRVTKGGKPIRKVNTCLTRDGKTIVCEWFNTPLTDEADNIIGLASLVREIKQ
jgi:PAS domain S-box-containing protein